MKKIRLLRNSYETPRIKMLPLAGCTVLAGSGEEELTLNPDDGTNEALSKENDTDWDHVWND